MNSNQGHWTFLSNHGHVLVCIARDPSCRLRDMADQIGITERAVQRIISELEEAGFVSHLRSGRRNSYWVHADKGLRHPLETKTSVYDVLRVLVEPRQLKKSLRPPETDHENGA